MPLQRRRRGIVHPRLSFQINYTRYASSSAAILEIRPRRAEDQAARRAPRVEFSWRDFCRAVIVARRSALSRRRDSASCQGDV